MTLLFNQKPLAAQVNKLKWYFNYIVEPVFKEIEVKTKSNKNDKPNLVKEKPHKSEAEPIKASNTPSKSHNKTGKPGVNNIQELVSDKKFKLVVLKPTKPTEDKPAKKLTHKEIKKHSIETVMENEHEENMEDDFFILKQAPGPIEKPTAAVLPRQPRIVDTKQSVATAVIEHAPAELSDDLFDEEDIEIAKSKYQTMSQSTIMFEAFLNDEDKLDDTESKKVSALASVAEMEKARELKKLKQAEQKRLETLRRRQEKEEEKRKLEEENWRQEQMGRAVQEALDRKEEERRQMRLAEVERRRKAEEALLEKERLEREKIEIERKKLVDKAKRMEEMKINFIAELNAKASKFNCPFLSKLVWTLLFWI